MNQITRRALGAMVAAVPLAGLTAHQLVKVPFGTEGGFFWIKKFSAETYATAALEKMNGRLFGHEFSTVRDVRVNGAPVHFNCRSFLKGVLK